MAPILIVLCILALVLWLFGRVPGFNKMKFIATSVICGILIALDTMIILASFDIYPGFNFIFICSWLLSIFFLTGFYISGGPSVIFSISIICIIFGYTFTGPYSGYVKHYIEEIKSPLRVALKTFSISFNDIILMLTNPQEYILKKQHEALNIEAKQTQPKGVEIKNILPSPDQVPYYQRFFVQVRIENEGSMKAENVSISLSCEPNKCEGNYSYVDISFMPNEAIVQQFGPFIAKEKNPGREAEVKVKLNYNYHASSSLIVEVMNEEEIKRMMTDPIKKYELFRNVVAVGKASPGMISLSVGEQPLFNGSTQILTASIINKRIGENEFVVLSEGTILKISLPKTIGSELSCMGENFECENSTKDENVEIVTCKVKKEIRIGSRESSKYPVICQFISADIKPEQVSRSDVITASLSKYTVEVSVAKGPIIMLTATCAKEEESCEKLNCCGILQCCEDKKCRIDCKKVANETEEPKIGEENYCEWRKNKYPDDPIKWCQEGEGNCNRGECSITIVKEGTEERLECRTGVKGIIKEKEIVLDIGICCFENQEDQECLEAFCRRSPESCR